MDVGLGPLPANTLPHYNVLKKTGASINGAVPKVECRVDPTAYYFPATAITIVQKPYSQWIEFLYGPFFKVIGFFYRIYTTNRARIARLKANAKVSSFIKFMTMIILVGWILIWYFASDESRTSLVDDVKQSIGISDSPSAQ
jgi:hypothetical protein